MIRVCKFCARFVEDAARKKHLSNGQRRGSLSRGSSLGIGAAAIDYRNAETESQLQSSPLLGATEDPSDVANSFLDPPGSPESGGGEKVSGLPPLFTIQSSESMDVGDIDDKLVQQPFQARPPGHRRRRSSVELLGAIESGGLRESDMKQLKLIAAQRDAPRASCATDEPKSFHTKGDADRTERDIALGKYLVRATPLLCGLRIDSSWRRMTLASFFVGSSS